MMMHLWQVKNVTTELAPTRFINPGHPSSVIGLQPSALVVIRSHPWLKTGPIIMEKPWDTPSSFHEPDHLPVGHLNSGGAGRGKIPKGFRRKAQGCEERATLGKMPRNLPTPTGLRPHLALRRQEDW